MNYLLILSLLFVIVLSKVIIFLVCRFLHSCIDDPHIVSNGYRIGYIDDDKNNVLVKVIVQMIV